ncbi:peptide chain release factor 3 [Brevibacterium sp. UMB1308A]|uniref:peptide chain release factor 3 n=1 Tax=Brevibacterium sp. UMB1308A TaxID=3050608 RepID=UPI00254ED7C3|nr:peptide chain release factor 3 [Brevibacterium sp. UMB1308A]MDK8345840.1 peptide chain release factor 3 [Brevibacterium sp. UMB1308B]MDK8712836.1 peptide chain release factor 3 [Brevibacterium sp. UMB1308A]
MTPTDFSPKEIRTQAQRRRTFAVISHPDAGKSTLTEALALHARVIGQAGATHGKAGRRSTVSDWMKMEQDRGISISSAALQFEYRDTVINLIDTPGHADFSEDTYRVLSSVDLTIMLVDAAKGLETQTMKLFDVCKHREIPIITVINKWDRPGIDALELMDEIVQRTGMVPTPLTWPVGQSGDFRGVLNREDGTYTKFTRTDGGATIAGEETMDAEAAEELEGDAWTNAVDESDLLELEDQNYDEESFLAGRTTPVMFASAVLNFGVHKILDTLVDIAPPAHARIDVDGNPREVDAPFSGFVFKVQAGMDSNHRDRLAYVRVCSGVFERGMVVTHAATGKPFATKYAQQVFGRDREVIDTAFPGDVVGLVNASALRVGDSLYLDEPVSFPPIPSFSPEHFMVIRAKDSSKYKQFRRGIEQLDHEGVIQVLRSDLRGDQAPVLGAVGPMQFEVAEDRMQNEFNAPCTLERLAYTIARRTVQEDIPTLARERSVEVLQRSDGTLLALFSDRWRLQGVEREHPNLTLEPLVVT